MLFPLLALYSFCCAHLKSRMVDLTTVSAALNVLGHGCEQALVTKEMDLTTAMNARAVCKSWRRLVKASILRSTFFIDFYKVIALTFEENFRRQTWSRSRRGRASKRWRSAVRASSTSRRRST